MRPAPSFFLMFLYGWGWFIYLYMNRIYYCYLQCAVHESIFLSSTRDLMGQQKGCWAIKNNLNHHQPSRRHCVSGPWTSSAEVKAALLTFQVNHPYISLAHSSTSTHLSWGEPPTPAASEHTCQSTEVGSYPKGQQLSSIRQTNNPMYAGWTGGLGMSYTFSLYIKTQLNELTITLQREPAIISLRPGTSADGK